MTPPVVSVQLAKGLQPPLCDAHASVSTPTDVMYRNNSSDDDDDDASIYKYNTIQFIESYRMTANMSCFVEIGFHR